MKSSLSALSLVVVIAGLAGCGSKSYSIPPASAPYTSPQAGALIDNPPTKVATLANRQCWLHTLPPWFRRFV